MINPLRFVQTTFTLQGCDPTRGDPVAQCPSAPAPSHRLPPSILKYLTLQLSTLAQKIRCSGFPADWMRAKRCDRLLGWRWNAHLAHVHLSPSQKVLLWRTATLPVRPRKFCGVRRTPIGVFNEGITGHPM